MMIFRDRSRPIWFTDNFIKIPQFNRKYPSGAAKERKRKQEK